MLKQENINEFLDDMREIMTYQESSEFVSRRIARTENTKITFP